MKTAIVTGACGFIGKALTKQLLDRGIEVFAVVWDKNKLADILSPNLHIINTMGKDSLPLMRSIDVHIDVFFHLAWVGVSGKKANDDQIQMENVIQSYNIFRAVSEMPVDKFIFAASSYEYKVEPLYIDNLSFMGNANLYGAAKHACRILCETYAAHKRITFLSILFTNVYGVGDFSNRSTNTLIRQLLNGQELRLINGKHLHDWTYIDDAIEGILAAAEKGKPLKEYYIGSRELRTFKDIVTEMRNVLAPDVTLKFGQYQDESYIDYSKIDLDALYRDTGFFIRCDFKESVRKTAEWIKQLNI